MTDWGKYAPAIERWAEVMDRPAPDPTDGKGRLNPALVEWMMGYPEGWVDGISRTGQLKALGNAIVPHQASAAWGHLLIVAMRNDLPSLLSQLREQRETEAWHCTVEGRTTPCGTCDGCRWHISSLRAALAAAERTVREQRRVIEVADQFIRACDSGVIGADVAGERELRSALAALAPNTEGEGT